MVTQPMTVGSLFAGIGGFDLGFERAGFSVKWQVEIDPFCQKVLAKHWPNVQRFEDVRTVGRHNLVPVDVICGGFPCQDISLAGRGAGIGGSRSGLWSQMHRIVGELRPRYVVVENVAALLGRGMGKVLGDLSEIGYDAEWQVISAADAGAPHLRKRIWIVAYPQYSGISFGRRDETAFSESQELLRIRCDERQSSEEQAGSILSDPDQSRLEERGVFCRVQTDQRQTDQRQTDQREDSCLGGSLSDPTVRVRQPSGAQLRVRRFQDPSLRGIRHSDNWEVEPSVGRVADGVPGRIYRLRALGNSVVPQIPEWIARQILKHEQSIFRTN